MHSMNFKDSTNSMNSMDSINSRLPYHDLPNYTTKK